MTLNVVVGVRRAGLSHKLLTYWYNDAQLSITSIGFTENVPKRENVCREDENAVLMREVGGEREGWFEMLPMSIPLGPVYHLLLSAG